MSNSQVVYTGGELWINHDLAANDFALDEGAMWDLIVIGKIDVSGAPTYEVAAIGHYTVLRPS